MFVRRLVVVFGVFCLFFGVGVCVNSTNSSGEVDIDAEIVGQSISVSTQFLNITNESEVGVVRIAYGNSDSVDYKVRVSVGGGVSVLIDYYKNYELEVLAGGSGVQEIHLDPWRKGTWEGAVEVDIEECHEEKYTEGNDTYSKTVCSSDVSAFPLIVRVGEGLGNASFPVSIELETQYELRETSFCQNVSNNATGIVRRVCFTAILPKGIPLSVRQFTEDLSTGNSSVNVSIDQPLYPYHDVKSLVNSNEDSAATAARLSEVANKSIEVKNLQAWLRDMQEKDIPEAEGSGFVKGGVIMFVVGVCVGLGAVYLLIKKKDEEAEEVLRSGMS